MVRGVARDHVQVEVGADLLDRHRAVLDEGVGAEEHELLGRVPDEDDRALGRGQEHGEMP